MEGEKGETETAGIETETAIVTTGLLHTGITVAAGTGRTVGTAGDRGHPDGTGRPGEIKENQVHKGNE